MTSEELEKRLAEICGQVLQLSEAVLSLTKVVEKIKAKQEEA